MLKSADDLKGLALSSEVSVSLECGRLDEPFFGFKAAEGTC